MRRKIKNMKEARRGLKFPLMLSLCISLFSAGSPAAFGHPEPSNKEPANSMTDKRNDIRARAEAQRHKANERAVKRRTEVNERREKHKQEAELKRIERQKVTEKYLNFKSELLTLLQQDGVIETADESVKIEYVDGAPIANSVNLSKYFGKKYEALWSAHGRLKTDRSSLNIAPGYFELKEVTEEGRSHHFVMQTN